MWRFSDKWLSEKSGLQEQTVMRRGWACGSVELTWVGNVALLITGHKQSQSNRVCYFHFFAVFPASRDLTFRTYSS